jgi:hypothetical protein
MPPECQSCQKAREDLEGTFLRGNFRFYPYAFSNYRSTRDSIPSILNNRLLQRTGEYFHESGRPHLQENQYFDGYRARNYDIRIYQSDYLLFSAPKYASAPARTYRSNSLKPLHMLDLDWTARLRQILIIYLRADRVWWGIWTRIMPRSLHFELIPVGPLAFRDFWPEGILSDLRNAKQNTLFLAHLLTPHYPYVYRADGSLRPSEEWLSHRHQVFYDSDAAKYRERYELYGEQVQFLNRQIAGFLDGLRASGHYESTTIVIHGDHGSRLRLLKSSERAARAPLARGTEYCPAVSRYDYVSPPELQDLLNRFSTLLAVKLPNAHKPEIVHDKGSVMFFLRQASLLGKDASSAPAAEDINSVYLFDEKGRPRAIPLQSTWRTPSENGSGG